MEQKNVQRRIDLTEALMTMYNKTTKKNVNCKGTRCVGS